MKADRVVVDTSVLISAALSAAGKPAAVVDHIVANGTLAKPYARVFPGSKSAGKRVRITLTFSPGTLPA